MTKLSAAQNLSTNWSKPSTNIFSALRQLTSALHYGMNARIIRIYNEDCAYPIMVDNNDVLIRDFRNYKFSYGNIRTKKEINEDTSMTGFEKYLSLNFKACFGNKDAVDHYYKTGILTDGNFKGKGVSHLVNVNDMIEFLQRSGKQKDKEYAKAFYHYIDNTDEPHFYDKFVLINDVKRQIPKKFNRKLWAVQTCKDKTISITPFYLKPLKYIPKISTYKGKGYKETTIIIGGNIMNYKITIRKNYER